RGRPIVCLQAGRCNQRGVGRLLPCLGGVEGKADNDQHAKRGHKAQALSPDGAVEFELGELLRAHVGAPSGRTGRLAAIVFGRQAVVRAIFFAKTPSSSFSAATNTSAQSFGSFCWGSVAPR